MPSFAVVSKMDIQEVDNALNQARKEISTRYDFQGFPTAIELAPDQKSVMLKTRDAEKLKAAREIVLQKLSKRGISLLGVQMGEVDTVGLGQAKQVLTFQQGIPVEKSKEMVKLLKESKLKLQGSIQGDALRVTGKSRDELQSAIALFRQHQDALAIDLQFDNFRD